MFRSSSLLAHASQFAFLFLVENPHIDKTYNLIGNQDRDASKELLQLYFRRDLTVFKNFDIFRGPDIFSAIFGVYTILSAFLVGSIDSDWKLYYYIGT